MAAKIPYFNIFLIIAIVNGRPAQAHDEGEFDLQKILQLLNNQGKYNVALSHHEDGPKSHHEDRARILQYRGNKPRYNDNKQEKHYATRYESTEDADYNRRPDNSLQGLNKALQNNGDKFQYKSNANDVLSQLLPLDSRNFKVYKARENYDNNDDIGAFLNDLQKTIADDSNFVSEIRCAGNRCGKDRSSRNDNNRDSLHCVGKNCPPEDQKLVRDESEDLIYDGAADGIQLDSKVLTKRIKLSDDLEAIVLGLSDVKHLLSKTASPALGQPSAATNGPALPETSDLENLLNIKANNKRPNVEAVVFDLTRIDDGDDVATQIKELLSENHEGRNAEFDDYVNTVRKNVEKSLKSDKTDSPKILPHNEDNNNLYVPRWLLQEILSKNDVKKTDVVQLLKSFFPKTKQQKRREWERKQRQRNNKFRRNFDQQLGIPFHLEVQGLGQVSPNAP
ncbi:hypothetical protein HF086_017483 [Spodoptera exigua]|uniref:Uncharacterized protein n=1 Tax=Spodoptera exigua TaxID=7107 RepID=A0A922M4F8_SPOEX|nr:hypothetical protein HF086_017483 [Spodoptera exigua]